MAEVLGIAGSIVGIIAFADEIASKGMRLYRSVKDCPQEIKILVDETDKLCGVLGTLKRQTQALIDPHKTTESHIHADSLLSGCEETLKQVDQILTKSETKRGETWGNMVKRIRWKYRKEDTIELLETLERHKSGFQLALSLDGMESLQQLLAGNSEIARQVLESKNETIQEIRVTKTKLLSGLEKIDDRQIQVQVSEEQKRKDDRRHEVLRWLSSVDFKAKHNEIQRNRCKNSGKWFLESPGFTAWLKQLAPKTLLCQGTPGAGKTYIMSTVLDHLESQFPDGSIGIAYIYCDFKQRTSQTPELMFASILQQLAYRRPNLDSNIDSLYENFRKEGKRPSLTELISAILLTSKDFGTIYIVFDALDECDEKTQRKDLLSCLGQLSHAPFKILATSRPHPLDIQNAFGEAGIAIIHAHSDDIEAYVTRRIEQEKSAGITISPDLTTTIVNQILLKAEGIFLLAAFQIDHILRHGSQKDKRNATKNLTSDLRTVYGLIMATIDKQLETRESTLNILRWVGAATRPLHFQELQIALSIEDGDTGVDEEGFLDAKTMVDRCGGLITIEQGTKTVRFIHYTVQEYLSKTTILDKAHFNITKTCLTYFSFEVPNKDLIITEGLLGGHCLLPNRGKLWDYAACNWGFHMRAADEPEDLSARALNTLQSSGLLLALARVMWYGSHWSWVTGGFGNLSLHIAAQLGLVRLVQLLLKGLTDEQADVRADSKDDSGRTPLSLAAMAGHEGVVRLLVGRADVDPDSKDRYGRTPLSHAAQGGHESVVSFLADRADVDADSKGQFGRTPLLIAALDGHESVVRLLVGRAGVNADSKDESGMTPLSLAATAGHEAVVRLLAGRADVSVNSRDRYGRTPLSLAARGGHEAVVSFLADRADVDAEPKDEDDRTPLSLASMAGHQAIVKLLAGRAGIDTDSKDRYGRTPLSLAARGRHESVVSFLADREDVDADSKDVYGRTPLSHAARTGDEAVVRLLAERTDVDMDSKDLYGRTPLSHAARGGHEPVVSVLADRVDVDADSKDEDGRTPLSRAAWAGYEAIVRLLADRVDVYADSKDVDGWTPLSIAARAGHETVVWLLADRTDVDVDSKDRYGRTPISHAAQAGHKEVFNFLAKRARRRSPPLSIPKPRID